MPEFDYKKHYLTESDSERIFRSRIVPREIAGKAEPVDQPVAIFVTAQPGAGKTQLTEAVVGSLADSGGCVQINSDTYKPYHPKWHQLLAQDDTTAAPYTAADGRRWMTKAEEYAAEHRLNVVLETTVRDPSVFREPIDRLRAAGYRIEVAALAVPQATSQMGILSRYAQQVQDKGASGAETTSCCTPTSSRTAVGSPRRQRRGCSTTNGTDSGPSRRPLRFSTMSTEWRRGCRPTCSRVWTASGPTLRPTCHPVRQQRTGPHTSTHRSHARLTVLYLWGPASRLWPSCRSGCSTLVAHRRKNKAGWPFGPAEQGGA